MKNGSRSEYFHVEGGLKLTRMRQSEWRRRWGIAGIVVFDAQVGAGVDDGYSYTGVFNNSASTSYIGKGGAGFAINTFSRFTNVTIPAGATIQAAYLIVVADGTQFDGAGVFTDIFFCDEDDPAAPTTEAEHNADPRTTASSAWDDEDFVTDAPTNSPSIASVIQEVIDRPGWLSGQAMLALWDDGGSVNANEYYRMYSYDGDTAKAMKLHVEYSA